VASVTIRELRNNGREVVDRVLGGESLVVTRSGTPVAELRPLGPPAVDAATLLARWSALPPIDPLRLRADIDRYVDASL
jgi:prevent-host-death family protein